jgi:hypothetical protein
VAARKAMPFSTMPVYDMDVPYDPAS